MTFIELPPHERMIIIAKIYHNIWYDSNRFAKINELLKTWDENPVKEAKFLHEVDIDDRQEKII